MSVLVWPKCLFPAVDVDWSLDGNTVTGGSNLAGYGQVGHFAGGGFWTLSLGTIHLRTREKILTARALQGRLDGGATPIIVSACEKQFSPRPSGEPAPDVPFGDDVPFSDDALFASVVVSAYVVSPAARRATRIDLAMVVSGPMIGGEQFSIVHPTWGKRMYRIVGFEVVDGVHKVIIRPPMREALVGGEVADFDDPGCAMQLADRQSIRVSVNMGRWSVISPTFTEYFGPMP